MARGVLRRTTAQALRGRRMVDFAAFSAAPARKMLRIANMPGSELARNHSILPGKPVRRSP
jgi:hypothetical protein